MRNVCLAAFAATLAALFPVTLPAANPPSSLSVTNYHLLSEVRQTRTTSLFTYSADLVNTGQAQPSITATVTSTVPGIVVQSGQGSLHFPPVGANGTVTSTDFFAVMVDRTTNADLSTLVWAFSTPVANAGSGQTVAVGATVTLDGSGSTNPSGIGTLTYSWAFATGGRPAGSAAVIQNPTSVKPTFVVDVAGTYTITLTVSNGAGVNSANVVVSTSNTAPVASAGPDQSVTAPATVTLDGSKSSDVDSDPLTYRWTLVQVPIGSTAVLTNPNTVSPKFTADKVGTYKAQLVVNDGHVDSTNTAIVTITSTHPQPVANAGPAQKVNKGSVVQLDGSKSTDVDGDPLTYHWSFNFLPSGSTATLSSATIVNPVFTADLDGTYVVQLIVNDGFDDSIPSTVTITTSPTILAPTAKAGQGQTVVHGSVVTLDGSQSSDPQNLPLTFRWSLTRPTGSTAILAGATTAKPTFTADLPGNYVAQLIVNNGTLDSAPATVTITTTNTAPVASAGTSQLVPVGSTVTLDGSKSSDADHDPLTYSWSLTTVPTGSSARSSLLLANTVSPTFIADVAGTYVAQLIVNDGFVNSDPSTVTISVSSTTGIALTPNPLNIVLNATGTVTVTIGVPAGPSGQDITLGVFDSSVATVPAKVTIPATATSVTATVTPVGVGTTQIIASAPGSGLQPGNTTVNVTSPSITLSLSNNTVGVTKTVTGTITLSAAAPAGGITVGLAALPAGIVSMPASVNIASGTTATFTITGVAAGSATITASSAGYQSGTANITAATLGAITLQPGVSVVFPQSTVFGVGLVSAAPAGGVTITLTSSDTSKLTVTPSVFIPAGATAPGVPAQVTGVAAGTATITASAGGFTGASADVTIIAGLSVSPSSLPAGTVGQAYGPVTISATGGTPPYTLSVANLPTGLSFNTTTGVLNGTPNAPGTATFTVKDTSPTPLTGTLTLTINPGPLVVTPADPLPPGITKQPYTLVNISASGGTPPYVLSAANLPPGMTFNPTTGDLSGTPSLPGTGTITIKDSASSPQVQTRTVTVTDPGQLVVTPPTLPGGVQNVAYPSTTITASSGIAPYTFSAANLPTGLTFNSTSHVLSGTPTGFGAGTITVKDSGAGASQQTVTLTVTIVQTLAIQPATLPQATVGQVYGPVTISAVGGVTPYTFKSDALPTGLSFNTTTAVLSGTPAAGGSFKFTVTDSTPGTPQTSSATLTINVGTLSVTPNPLPVGQVGTAYPSTTLVPSGGTAPYTFSSTTLPAGMSFNTTTGVLSGTPSAPGNGTITVTDSGAGPLQQSVSLPLTINPGPLVISPAQAAIPAGAVNVPYPSTTFTATGGTPPYVFSGSNIPNGMSFNAGTGVLSGTPLAAGTGTISVHDSASPQKTDSRTFTVSAQLTVTPATLPIGAVGAVYPSTTIIPSGGNPPYVLSVTGLPTGMTFNASTGVLSGTPGVAGTATITVKDSTPVTINLTLTINPALVVSPASLPPGTATVAYPSTTVSATGGTPPYSFSVSGLPAGMSFNTATGVLSGTPAASGTATITVKDSTSGAGLSGSLTLTVNPQFTVAPSTLPTGTTNVAYPSTTLVPSGGQPPYIFSASGLPAGLNFNTSTGVLSGTPTANGSGTITVTDSTTPTANSQQRTVTVSGAKLQLNHTALPAGKQGDVYNQTVTATGGTTPYNFVATGLPSGLTMRTNGQITGVPSVSGTFPVLVTVTDAASGSDNATFSLVIAPATLTVMTTQLPTGIQTFPYPNNTLVATGGVTPYTWSIASGSLPAGLSLNPNGRIEGTVAANAVTTTFTLGVHDSGSPVQNAVSGPLTININPPGPNVTITGASVGKDLETALAVSLNGFGGQTDITISSDNPNVLLTKFPALSCDLSSGVCVGGSQSITIQRITSSFIVYVEGLASSGTANITAHSSTPGAADGTSVITLSPSGFVLSGPNGVGGSLLLNQNSTTPLNVIAQRLDSAGKVQETQAVRSDFIVTCPSPNPGGPTIQCTANPIVVALSNTNTAAGTLQPTSVAFGGGVDTISVNFNSAISVSSQVNTIVTATPPATFSTPAGNANVIPISVQPTSLTPTNATVGKGLETTAQVILGARVTSTTPVTITSNDPTKVVFSTAADVAGSASIVMNVVCTPQGCGSQTQLFYVQGLASTGTVGYTASAPGIGTATGLITLTPSGFVLENPFGSIGQNFNAVTGNAPSFMNIDAYRLDSAGNIAEIQALAGTCVIVSGVKNCSAPPTSVIVNSGNKAVGTVLTPVTIAGGTATNTTQFTPLGAGSTLLSLTQPAGFSTPVSGASLTATVTNPGINLNGNYTIGQDLEQQGTFFLGVPAPSGGTQVILSVTAGALQLSNTPTGAGATSITVNIPAGQFVGSYYMYARNNIGTATVSASAPGYNSAGATNTLAPSGIVVSDQFTDIDPMLGSFDINTTVGNNTTFVTVSTAALSPSTSQFLSVQALAPTSDGQPLQATVLSGTPGVGTIDSPAVIAIGTGSNAVHFTPIAPGTTQISARSAGPSSFVTPTSGRTVNVNVQ